VPDPIAKGKPMNGVMTREYLVSENLNSLMSELYALVHDLQKIKRGEARWREVFESYRAKLEPLIQALKDMLNEGQLALRRMLEEVEASLRSFSEEMEESPSMRKIKQARLEFSRRYEDLAAQVRAWRKEHRFRGVSLPRIKATNYLRNVFHMSMGLFGILMYEFVLSQPQAMLVLASILAVFLSLEISRRYSRRWNLFLVDKVFGGISRPSERYRINGSTCYLTALFLLVGFVPQIVAEMALVVLAFGDPAASIVGKRFGSLKLYREKSLAGTVGFVLAAFTAGLILLGLADHTLGLSARLTVCGACALTGALAELFSDRIDDNFTIPMLTAGVALLWF